MGSTCRARRAGTMHATSAITAMTPMANASDTGSLAPSPNSSARRYLASAKDAAVPTTSPTPASAPHCFPNRGHHRRRVPLRADGERHLALRIAPLLFGHVERHALAFIEPRVSHVGRHADHRHPWTGLEPNLLTDGILTHPDATCHR